MMPPLGKFVMASAARPLAPGRNRRTRGSRHELKGRRFKVVHTLLIGRQGEDFAKQLQVGIHPPMEFPDALFNGARGTPAKILEGLPDICHKHFLIALSGRGKTDFNRRPALHLKPMDELFYGKLILRATADVINLAGDLVALLPCQAIRINQVINKEKVAGLFAVAKDGDGAAQGMGNQEPGDPALIRHAELTVPINAGLTETNGGQSINSGIIPHVLVRGPFGAGVGGMKIKRLLFRNSFREISPFITAIALNHGGVLQTAINLVGGGEDKQGLRTKQADAFEKIEGAQNIVLQIEPGIGEGRRHRNLPGTMKHQIIPFPLKMFGYGPFIADINPGKANRAETSQPLKIVFRAVAGEVVPHKHIPAVLLKTARRVGANEPGSPGDEYSWYPVFSHCSHTGLLVGERKEINSVALPKITRWKVPAQFSRPRPANDGGAA